jgi:putative transposase
MKINKSYKFRIYPTKIQKEIFEKHFGATRFIYNSVLAYKIDAYKHGIKYSAYDAMKDLTEIKKLEGYEWLQELSTQAIQQTILNLDDTFQRFYKQKGRRFPKFKSKKNTRSSFRIPQNFKIDFKNKKIKIPKIDWIKFRDKRIFTDKICNITISKNRCNQYFASILVEEEFEINLPQTIKEDKVFSADMSAKYFLVSQDMEFENQKFYRKNERRLKIRQRRLSRKKYSNNREKEKLKIAKTHLNITNERKGYQWGLAHDLIQKFDAFCFEDLNVAGMLHFNKGLTKTLIFDFSFSKFLINLEWKCLKENKHFIKVDRYFPSSKLCFECGEVKKKLDLLSRSYVCDCGYVEDRDINAAKNIKREGIRLLQEKGINLLKNSIDLMSESYACGNMSEDVNSSAQESLFL